MDRDNVLLTPGPLTTTLQTKLAMLRDWGSWDADFNAITARVRSRLLEIVGATHSHVVVPLQGSGTFAVEAAITTVVPRDGHLLVLDNGAYCKRMAKLATMMGRQTTLKTFTDATAISAGDVEALLVADPSVTHVGLVHCETGTGVVNQLEAIAEVCRRRGAELIVDAMSSFGALPINAAELGLAALVAASGKCLEGVPGMGFVFLRRDLLEGMEGRSHSLSLDLYDQYTYMERTGQWRFTPPTHVVAALDCAIGQYLEEGQASRLRRYTQNFDTLITGAARLGLKPYLAREDMSPIIVTLLAPDSPAYSFDVLYQTVKKRGYLLYPGKLTDVETFRVGCIGAIDDTAMEQALEAIGAALKEMGIAD